MLYTVGMDKKEMMAKRLSGASYRQIAEEAKLSPQRIQQLIGAPRAIRIYVFKKYKNRCAHCGILVGSWGHIHHEGATNGEDYNDIDNLILLCPSCHARAHKPPRYHGWGCPDCGSNHLTRAGHRKDGSQRYRCEDCGRLF